MILYFFVRGMYKSVQCVKILIVIQIQVIPYYFLYCSNESHCHRVLDTSFFLMMLLFIHPCRLATCIATNIEPAALLGFFSWSVWPSCWRLAGADWCCNTAYLLG